MHRVTVAALVLAGLLALAVGLAGSTDGAATQEEIDPDDVVLDIALTADGHAAWTVTYRIRLQTDEDVEAFEDLQADIEADPTPYLNRFRDRMMATADAASDRTGREMAIEDVTVDAERRAVPTDHGIVTYRFTWVNFAHVEGHRMTAGDAIDGLFLDDQTTLRIHGPPNGSVVDAAPEPTETREGAVIWRGPERFADGQPRATFTTDRPSHAWAIPTIAPYLVALAVLLLVFLAVPFRGTITERLRDTSDADADAESLEALLSADPSVLSNEELVLEVLAAHGGRMRQADLANTLGWTAAKTSQVTKRLREEGKLEAFRKGRENVLESPDEF